MKLFGRKKKQEEVEDEAEEEEEVVENEEEKVDQPIAIDYYARYIGGHPLYPNERDVFVVFWTELLPSMFIIHCNSAMRELDGR